MTLPLVHRPRRLRRTASLRALVRETSLSVDHLVLPLFVDDEPAGVRPVQSMPGVVRWSVDRVVEAAERAVEAGVPGVLLFGVPSEKHDDGRGAWDSGGVVQRALARIKRAAPELLVMTDVCLCEYTTHGHCGLVPAGGRLSPENDASVELLVRTALSHAAAGADVVAPSDMFDGRVGAIRRGLDEGGFDDVALIAYAAKYASAFYGPFREAAGSAPSFGDRRTHQMDPANAREALHEMALDAAEGADVLMVKPALAYLDILARARPLFSIPLAAYNVSGEYAMVKAAAAAGWIDERRIVLESLTAMRRAGADIVFTYHALEVATWLRES